jgi:hypothetical protein
LPRFDPHAERFQLLFRGGVLFSIAGPDHHAAALLGNAAGETQAEATVAACHQRDLAAQIEEAFCHGSPMVR